MIRKISKQNNLAKSTVQEDCKTTSKVDALEPDIVLSGSLDVSDYIQDVSPSKKTIQDLSVWKEKQRENTRTNLVLGLTKTLGVSSIGTLILIGIISFNPTADKELFKALVPTLFTTQITLLSCAFGFYFGSQNDKL